MFDLALRIANSPSFQRFNLSVIVVTAVLIGAVTSETLVARYGRAFEALELADEMALDRDFALLRNPREQRLFALQAFQQRAGAAQAAGQALAISSRRRSRKARSAGFAVRAAARR